MTITRRTALASLTLAVLATLVAPLAPAAAEAQTSVTAAQSRGSAAIQARDLDATVRWYRDNLGFRVISERSAVRGRSVVLERRGMLLEIAEAESAVTPRAAAPREVETTASTAQPILSLLVGDVDAEIDRLAERDVTIVFDPTDDVDGRFRTASVRDPEGRVLELREPLAADTGDIP